MTRRAQKQKAKIAKRLAITSALILLLTFVVKEILQENFKGLHDRLASAEIQFRNETGQTTLSIQILAAQQQIETLRLETQARHNHPNRDYSALISHETFMAKQAQGNLDVDLDATSRLIDTLPARAQDLRQLRNQIRKDVEKTDRRVNDVLKPTPDNDVLRFVQVKLATIMALTQEVPVIILGDRALSAAQQVQEASEILIRVCERACYVFACVGLGLVLYAAITGIKPEVSE